MALNGYNIRGIEFNEDYCTITRLRGRRHNINIDVICGKGEKLPYEDNYFDFVYCDNVLEHCEDPAKVLQECQRVLRSGGQMYTAMINRFGFKDPHYHLRFVNWMPRFFADKYVIWRGKIKDSPLFKDRQKLSEMHYFSYPKF